MARQHWPMRTPLLKLCPDMLYLGQSLQLARLHIVPGVFLMCPAVFLSVHGPSTW